MELLNVTQEMKAMQHQSRLALISFSCLVTLTPHGLAQSPVNTSMTAGEPRHHDLPRPLWGLVPTSGGEGTRITAYGDFASESLTYSPVDVLMTGLGPLAPFGRVDELTPTTASGHIQYLPIHTAPDLLALRFGTGVEVPVPPLAGIGWTRPAWVWVDAGNGATWRSERPFSGSGRNIFAQGSPDPEPRLDAVFRFDGAGSMARAVTKLPGAGTCLGDRISIWLVLQTVSGDVAVHVPQSEPLLEQAWSNAHAYALHPLSTALAGSGFVASYDAALGELSVAGIGHQITGVGATSHVRIDMDPSAHPVFTEVAGIPDGHLPPFEVATPSAVLFACVDPLRNCVRRNYDDQRVNCGLAETFDAFGVSAVHGPVRTAVLSGQIRAIGAELNTDHIQIGWDGTCTAYQSWAYTAWFHEFKELNERWVPAQDAFISFNLSALVDPRSSAQLDVVPMLQGDSLDVVIYDDTAVDYLELRARRCFH